MKQILLRFILVVSLIICIGCSNHKHKYGEWVIDETGHYHPLICDGCNQPTVMEPHKDLTNDNKCDDCGYAMGEEHLFKWIGTEEGHHKKVLCGCCDYEEVYSHVDNDKDNICDVCKYSMLDIDISWLYSETHHWYQYGDKAEVFEYDFHTDTNSDFACDVCEYPIPKQEIDVLKTTWIYEDGAVMFEYEFSIGDTYRFDDRNIYINDALVFEIDDSCNYHRYEYYIDSIKIRDGIYEGFTIKTIEVKKILNEYKIEIHNYNPYNEYPAKVPFNCEIASLGMDVITPGDYSTHRCVGLYFDNNFENEVTDSFEVLEMENKVLYVKWEEIPITITLDLNNDITDGIEAKIDEDKIIEIRYNEEITLPVPLIEGFEFIGWYDGTKRVTDNKGEVFWDICFLEDVNLKAKWVRNGYYFNVKQIDTDNVTNVLEIGKGSNKTEHIIPDNALSNNLLAVIFIKDVMEELYEDALRHGNIHADYCKPGYHVEFFTSVLNDVNTREYLIDLEDYTNGFTLYPYYEKNEYSLEIYDGEKFVNFSIDYETALNKYKLGEPLFETMLEKEGYLLLNVYTLGDKYILDSNNRLLSDGLECLELRFNDTGLSGIAQYVKK